MELKELIKAVCNSTLEDTDTTITFDIGIDDDGKTIMEYSKNRVKFTIKKKEANQK